MKSLAIISLLFLSAPACAADKALMLNDQEQAALRHVLDVATKAQGIEIAPMTVYLLNKLNAAGVVTESKEIPAQPKAAEPTREENWP